MALSQTFRQIDSQALHRLAEVFQKEVSSLISYYLKDSEKLMENLRNHISHKSYEQVTCIARELRENSLEVGATYFSFLMLGFEIAAQERRVSHWEASYETIKKMHADVAKELLQMSQKKTCYMS